MMAGEIIGIVLAAIVVMFILWLLYERIREASSRDATMRHDWRDDVED
jgi:hypothetical protein